MTRATEKVAEDGVAQKCEGIFIDVDAPDPNVISVTVFVIHVVQVQVDEHDPVRGPYVAKK